MHVDYIQLEDFRNYADQRVEFAPGLNLVVGRNAQGKTNLLEAVHCLSGMGSPRGPEASLIKSSSERALLHSRVERRGRSVEIDMEMRTGRGTRLLINKVASQKRAFDQLIVTVFFGPDELSLVKGSPDGRRRFLDDLVVKLRPARDQLRKEWARVLKQRNALLKSARSSGGRDAESFEVWDEAFCRAGAALAGARLEALAALLPYAVKRFEEIAGRGTLELGYVSSWLTPELIADPLAGGVVSADAMADALRDKIERLRVPEIERGMSLAGPQRDDVSVALPLDESGELLEARTYASQGDQRTSALALKLAEHDLLTAALDESPVLLMDDVFSELDPHRRTWLAKAVREMGQTLLSSAEAPGTTLQADRTFEIVGGRVSVHG